MYENYISLKGGETTTRQICDNGSIKKNCDDYKTLNKKKKPYAYIIKENGRRRDLSL